MPSRRDYLAGFLAAGASGITGCSGVIGEPQVAVSKIRGINHDTRAHTVAVTLSENGRNVHQSEQRMSAGSEQIEGAWFVIEEELPDSPGRYELGVELDDSITDTLDLASEYEDNRLQIIIDIDEHGRISLFVNRSTL